MNQFSDTYMLEHAHAHQLVIIIFLQPIFMTCKKYTKEMNVYPNNGYGKKLIFQTIAMKKVGKHMNTCM